MKSTLLLLFTAFAAHADIIRLSNVAEKAGAGITRFELGEGENAQILFVEDKAIITEADIAQAIPSLSREDSIDITLTKEGTEKMIAATTLLRPSIARIAIFVDGKILSAPVVQSVPLGKNFLINGLDEENQPRNLAARLSGKSEQQIADELAAREQLPPPPEPVFHTEEEYRLLKAKREKLGLYFMDRVYSEEELGDLLKVGMKEAEVIAIFGKPRSIKRNDEGTSQHRFETSPEKLPDTPEFHLDAFEVDFLAGKMTGWRTSTWSKTTRAPKPTDREQGNLLFKTPPADMSSENFDIIAFYEGHEISLKPGKTKPTKSDHHDLLAILWMLTSMPEEGQSVDSQCDIVRILTSEIPELAALAKKSKQGRIALTEVKGALQLYIHGEKELK